MDTKLTLRMNDKLISKAKKIAKSKGVSLSKLVSDFFKSVSREQKEITESPILTELSGILPSKKSNQKLVEDYKKHLQRKHR